MTDAVEIFVAVERESDKEVAKVLVATAGGIARPPKSFGGKAKLDLAIPKLNRAGVRVPYLVLRDCDHDDRAHNQCRGLLAGQLAGGAMSEFFSLRFPIRSIEAWLLADRQAFANHFRLPLSTVPAEPDQLPDPKDALLGTIHRSKLKGAKEGMLPRKGSGRSVEPEYVSFLNGYVLNAWSITEAAANSESLTRAIAGVTALVDRWRAAANVSERAPRVLGQFAGKIRVSDDFGATPAEVVAAIDEPLS